jgi:hypothetical protein
MSKESNLTDFEQGKLQGKKEMLEYLEKEIERLKKKSTGGLNSEYARAWDDGYGSAMRDIISITKGEAAKKAGG